jgi:hypothetical protein
MIALSCSWLKWSAAASHISSVTPGAPSWSRHARPATPRQWSTIPSWDRHRLVLRLPTAHQA